jgi:XTP/dITP diphosphohydrolase
MQLLLASNNRDKAEEFRRIFSDHRILLPADAGVSFDFDEDANSFLENAIGKARALFAKTALPVLADDSGLVVAALNGEPGVYSARYGSRGGKNLSAAERNRYLLSRLGAEQRRDAFFVCCMVLILEPYRFYVTQETFAGIITESPRGKNGFGYDPVFLVPEYGKTAAELSDSEKDRISHRGKAARRILSLLAEV